MSRARPPEWSDWTWQMRQRIRSVEALREWLEPTPEEREGIEKLAERFHFVITPYYAALMDPDDPACPIRRQVVPSAAELDDPAGLSDPLDEVAHSPVKNVIRVYEDRIAFCVNNECALYCRFCLRKRMVGEPEWAMKRRELEVALDWIRRTPAIRDVLLTGGDPLVLSPRRLRFVTSALAAIDHLKVLRIHTRVPIAAPERVTAALVRAIKIKGKPTYVAVHVNHPRELTGQARAACARMADAGIPLLSQTVLLAGVNDSPVVMGELMRALVECRIKPYYLHHPDLAAGTEHLRTGIETGQHLMRALRGRLSGLCQPTYVLDIPGGYGKSPIGPSYLEPAAPMNAQATVVDFNGARHLYPPR